MMSADVTSQLHSALGIDHLSLLMTSQMAVLGANLNLEQKLLTLDPDKAISYAAQVRDAQSHKSMRMTEFLSLTEPSDQN